MPSPALSAAASKLVNMTGNPLGRAQAPSTPSAPSARPSASMTSGGAFSDVLSQQLGLTDQLTSALGGSTATDPFSSLIGGSSSSALSSSLASPQIAKALATAQKNVGAAASSAASAAGSAITAAGTALTGAASTKAKNALAWAKSMLGRQDWNNLCERFVEEAYGTRGVYPTAIDAGKQLVTHRGSSSLRTAPAGALLYFTADDTNDHAGHAAIYLGNGEMISARPDGVKVERVDTPYNNARYLGWSAPPAKFPGRKTAASNTPATRPAATQPARPTSAFSVPIAPRVTPGAAISGGAAATTSRSAPASGSSLATPGLAAVPPALRQPPRSAGSPR